MQHLQGGSPTLEIARKWHDLAQRRLDQFIELYRSGRWRHYYTEERFAVRMNDVIKAVKLWGDLAGRPRSQQAEQAERAALAKGRDDKMRSAA